MKLFLAKQRYHPSWSASPYRRDILIGVILAADEARALEAIPESARLRLAEIQEPHVEDIGEIPTNPETGLTTFYHPLFFKARV